MERICRLWLLAIARVSRQTVADIIDEYGSAEAFYNLTDDEIKSIKFISKSEKDRILKKDLDLAENYLDYISKNGTRFLIPEDDDFPKALLNIADSPKGLFCRGKWIDMNRNILVAVVGARKCTQYGYSCAKTISKDIARAGAIIVSGMAMGIDSAAHEGALEVNMPTIAVLGCGVNVVYPPSNHALMKRIMETGMVISEYPVNTEPAKHTFPERNRIISGVSNGVVVVEASERSGSLITARYAMEQDKDLFAVPGNINSTYSKGTNELIKDTAKLITCADDITFYYASQLEQIRKDLEKQNIKRDEYSLTPDDNNDIEQSIISSLTSEPVSIEQLSEITGIEITDLSTALLVMELSGKVISYPDGKYSSAIN